MDTFIIDPTTNTLTAYEIYITQGYLEYLYIPHFYHGKQIDAIGPHCFGNVQIDHLAIQEGIQKLEDMAFEGSHCCHVYLPHGLKIGKKCFQDSRLQEITLPSDLDTIEYCTFSRCKNLTSIYQTSNVKVIGNQAFSYCKSLRNICFTGLSSVEEAAFIGCANLEEAILGSHIQHMEKNIFCGCNNLKKVAFANSFGELDSYTFM